MWLTFFVLSVICFILSLSVFFVISSSTALKKKILHPFKLLFSGVWVSAFFLYIPMHFAAEGFSVADCLEAVFMALADSKDTFGFSLDFDKITGSLDGCPQWLSVIYLIWTALIFIIAPAFSVGFVLSLFKNASAYMRYLCVYFRDVYVFSELNEKSLILASDIKAKNKNAAIVFADVFDGNEEKSYKLAEKAKLLGAICFRKDILSVNFRRHSSKKAIWFFTIGKNESENLTQALSLTDAFKDRDNIRVYVFSIKTESELLLTDIDKGKVKVRRINEVQSLISRNLYEHGDIIFDGAKEGADGERLISAVVVGMGSHGTEMVKALTWYGQMDGYRIRINAFDKDPLAEEKFTALAPELMSPDYNGVYREGEAQYCISVCSGADVQTKSFADRISAITDATYVFVALGDDDININTAVRLRMYFERMKIHPVIQAVVYNTRQKKALEGIKNYRGQAYDIDFVGDIETSYAENVIIASELEARALAQHLKWGKEEEFWTYEYNYRSSVAQAIHMKAREKCLIPGAAKREDELTAEERDIIETLEHRRWNAYMRAEGYVFSGTTDKSGRNDLAKMHHDLVDFSSLSEEEKRKDSRVGTR